VVHPTEVQDLEGKVALVTGATSGIGRAAALQLAAQGAAVVVHGRDASRGIAVVAEIENAGGSARFVGADLSEPAEALRLAEEAGDVDILVNNAGFAWFGPSAKLAVNTLDRLFAANVQAPYLLASVLAPKMVARGGGVIINVASRAGTVGQPDTRRVRRHQGRTGLTRPLLGRRIRTRRNPRQRHLTRTRLHQCSRPRTVRRQRRDDPARPGCPAAGDRRSHRLPGFPPRRVYHRHQHRRRRRRAAARQPRTLDAAS